jgi:hypothetical protein
MERSGKNNWIGVIIIVVILIGAFFFVSRNKPLETPEPVVIPTMKSINEQPLFAQGLGAVNITADQIGFHAFSPKGTYFFFTTFKNGGNPANAAHLLKLSDNTIATLPGSPDRVIEDERVIQLYSQKGMTLYFTATGQSKTYDVGDNYGFGALSPDGKIYIVNTQEGIKKIDVDTGLVTSFTKAQYDGAYAWYADNNRVLGFKESGENLFEAGKGRTLGIWNMTTGDFTPLDAAITDKNIRMVQWVVPGAVARVNTGWDDGSHDYLINVDTKKTIDIGDTSGALMGGVVIDPFRGLFAVVGGDDQAMIGSKVMVYRGMEKIHETTLEKGYFRQKAQIVDTNRLIYIRTRQGSTGTTAQQLVLLDLNTGTETVVKDLSAKEYVSLSMAPDHKTWVLSQGKSFILGTL